VDSLDSAVTLYNSQQITLAQLSAQTASAQGLLDNLAAPTMPADPTNADAMTAYANSYQNYAAFKAYLEAQVSSGQQIYAQAKAASDTIRTQLDGAKAALFQQGILTAADVSDTEMLTQARAKLKEMQLALTEGQLSISTAYGDLEKAEQQLEQARRELDDGWDEYNDGVAKLAEAKTDFAAQKADAEKQLADAEDKISDAQAKIDEIDRCEWYVLDRDSITSFVTFEQNADRIADIAQVFPVFFFLVAALVALTTMTRMVDENRQQIGTLKALGYSEAAISAKYLLYALTASLSGAAAGILVGFAGFPSVIWYAYSIMYTVPTFRILYYPELIVISLALSVAVITAATLNACHATLREKPAALMLPKAPPAGRRILLEYITPIWSRMSFSYKVTARNLMRYKKRFFMTVLGVAGCTALLLVGFGIQDSIMDIVSDQFTRLNHYDLTVSLSSEKALTETRGLSDILSDTGKIEYSAAFYTKSVTISNEADTEGTVTLTVCEDDAAVPQFFTFQTRVGHHPIDFGADSVILTEKTAENLGVQVGDTVFLHTDGGRAALTVTGITENYIYSRLFVARSSMKARSARCRGGTRFSRRAPAPAILRPATR
jgi:putative ABC transport system permease protein